MQSQGGDRRASRVRGRGIEDAREKSEPGPARRALAGGVSARIGMAFSALALVLFGITGGLSGTQARRESEREAAQALRQLADRLAERLDGDMAERYREINRLATLEGLLETDLGADRWRALLERVQSSMMHYSWIGLADRSGKVLAATGGLLEGRQVDERPWFRLGLLRPMVGDVHEAKLLASMLPAYGGEPLRFVDVAAPLRRDDATVGVIGAHLSWAWAEERRLQLLAVVPPSLEVEILLLDQAGERLLGPERPMPVLGARESVNVLADAATGRDWSDNRRYLTAARHSQPSRDYPGMGWTVVVRQSEARAFEAADALQRQLWLFGAVGALLFGIAGWWLAGSLTRPLRVVAERARELVPTSRIATTDEVDQLGHSLAILIEDLQAREEALRALNEGLEARVRERTGLLQKANEDLHSFGRSVSHDLRGPLGSMGVLLRNLLVRGTPLPEDVRRTVEMVAEEAERLSRMTAELLTLAMVEQRGLDPVPVEMRRLVEEVLAELGKPDGPQPEVAIGELPTVTGDAVLLRQVWTNLLSNAFKFSSKVERPRVEVSARTVDGEIEFCVADNGAGFDPEHASRLFGVFQRLHGHAEFPGTGVGLSIVRLAVHRHGGRVWAESAPGAGARFRFTLPASAPDDAAR